MCQSGRDSGMREEIYDALAKVWMEGLCPQVIYVEDRDAFLEELYPAETREIAPGEVDWMTDFGYIFIREKRLSVAVPGYEIECGGSFLS